MLSFQIIKEIKRLLESFDEAKYFFGCLESINLLLGYALDSTTHNI